MRAPGGIIAVVAAIAVVAPAVAAAGGGATADARAGGADDRYGLDDVPRYVPPTGRVICPKVPMVRYRGAVIRYHKPVRVYVGFRERLEKFERIVREVAIEVYGRAPRRIVHIGTYNCRRIRRYPTYLSEHALGNGIDIAGFDFGPARGRGERAAAPHRRLRRAFRVRVADHWGRTRGVDAIHAEFLRRLTDRLVGRDDVFRVLLGPAWPGHKNHFHFDCAPWRIVEI